MDKEKRRTNPLVKIVLILFVVFIGFYIALESGYYPTRTYKKVVITDKKKDLFEKSLNNNENIKLQGYVEEDIDYSNFVTKTGNAVTATLAKVFVEGTSGVKTLVKILFW